MKSRTSETLKALQIASQNIELEVLRLRTAVDRLNAECERKTVKIKELEAQLKETL